MDPKDVRVGIGASIVQFDDGTYGALISWIDDGTTIVGPWGTFGTPDEARRAGSAFLTEMLDALRRQNITAYRQHEAN